MSDDSVNFGILKKHKNSFLQLIKRMGLDPEEFRTEEKQIDRDVSFEIQFRNTPLRYVLRRHADNYETARCRYTKFTPDFKEISTIYAPMDSAFKRFQSWLLNEVKEYLAELTAPDLWAQIQSQTPVVSDGPVGSDDREPFTQPEQAQLRMAIKEFRQLVIDKFEHTDEHLSLIDDRLDYLTEQVGLLNRINWRSLALSTLISITIALSLNNEQGNKLFELFRQIFSNIVPLLPQ